MDKDATFPLLGSDNGKVDADEYAYMARLMAIYRKRGAATPAGTGRAGSHETIIAREFSF
jgi:hypothetical protein